MFRRIPWQDVCKFLAGAFFVSAGILFYLYLARVSVPILGTRFTETPEVSGARSIVHVVLFSTSVSFESGKAVRSNERRRPCFDSCDPVPVAAVLDAAA